MQVDNKGDAAKGYILWTVDVCTANNILPLFECSRRAHGRSKQGVECVAGRLECPKREARRLYPVMIF